MSSTTRRRPTPAPDPQTAKDGDRFEFRLDPAAAPGDLLPPLARLLLAMVRSEAAARPVAEAGKEAAR